MTFTPYLTQEEIESFIGWSQSSLSRLGEAMTSTEWALLLGTLNNGVSAWINRFTRRNSFFESTYVEYHDGKGRTGDLGEHLEYDRVFFFMEQPVTSVTTVEENVAHENAPESWVTRTLRSSSVAGDYHLPVRGDFTALRFLTNIPRQGKANLRFTYNAGYVAGDPVLDEVKLIALEMILNFLELKKKTQEADAVRWNSTQEAANMFQLGDKRILTDDLKARLLPYQRRATMNGKAWR